MQILYLSRLASKAAIAEDSCFVGNAVQKFNRLIAEGLVRNGQSVIALSTFFITKRGLLYRRKGEVDEGVRYNYIITPQNRILRSVWLGLYCFFKVFFWGIYRKKEKALVADVLNISACMGAVAASRLIGLRCVGIMTDMPGLMVDRSNKRTRCKGSALSAKLNKSFLGHFTHYVFLTEQMNQVVNTKHRPYIIMEGLVDADMTLPEYLNKDKKKIVLYAGGLHERYGLKMLVEGFAQLEDQESELWIYGNGPFAVQLNEYIKQDARIRYMGIRPNNEVVEAEQKATLLVNPRPTHELFTKYSFPSKNMEYMVSGTPVLTTMLPGMPEEYYPYVFLFDCGETTEGYFKVLRRVLSLSTKDLQEKGYLARQWVLKNKNHIKQTARIIDMLGK